MNLKGGIESIDNIIAKGKHPLTAKEFQTVWESMDALVLDTRSKENFSTEHIPGSIFIGMHAILPLGREFRSSICTTDFIPSR